MTMIECVHLFLLVICWRCHRAKFASPAHHTKFPGLPWKRLYQWHQHHQHGSERRAWNPHPTKGAASHKTSHGFPVITSLCLFSLSVTDKVFFVFDPRRKRCTMPAETFCSNRWLLPGPTTTCRSRASSGSLVCLSSSSSARGTTRGCWCSRGLRMTWAPLSWAWVRDRSTSLYSSPARRNSSLLQVGIVIFFSPVMYDRKDFDA